VGVEPLDGIGTLLETEAEFLCTYRELDQGFTQ
jgi:hypothetical protein